MPNFPLWTGLSLVPEGSKATVRPMLTNASSLPFINVSFSGLLWGYEDELYCLKLDVPKGCKKGNDPFSSDDDDAFEDAGDDWGDFKRRKRSVSSQEGIFEKSGEVIGSTLYMQRIDTSLM